MAAEIPDPDEWTPPEARLFGESKLQKVRNAILLFNFYGTSI